MGGVEEAVRSRLSKGGIGRGPKFADGNEREKKEEKKTGIGTTNTSQE